MVEEEEEEEVRWIPCLIGAQVVWNWMGIEMDGLDIIIATFERRRNELAMGLADESDSINRWSDRHRTRPGPYRGVVKNLRRLIIWQFH